MTTFLRTAIRTAALSTVAAAATTSVIGSAAFGVPAADSHLTPKAADPSSRPVVTSRLMPLGDSITHGTGSSTGNGYRGPLHQRLNRTPTAFNFVGSQRNGSMKDKDNEGHSGYRIGQLYKLTKRNVAKYRPNVVTLHAGTNDMNQNFKVKTAPQRLKTLIDKDIFAVAPHATVVVSTLVPSKDPAVNARIKRYNAAIPGVVSQLQKEGHHVLLVKMDAVTTKDLANKLHPNDNGYRKMAAAFERGVERAVAKGWAA